MDVDKWKKKRRAKALDKVNRELEELKKKGLEFEKNGSKAKKEVAVVKKSCNVLKILAAILVVGWVITFFMYGSKVSNLKTDVEELDLELQVKTLEAQNLTDSLFEIESELEGKKKGEDELSQEVSDLLEIKDTLDEDIEDLEDEIKDLKLQIDELEVNLTIQERLVYDYEDCITDPAGFDEELSFCDSFM